MGNLTFVITEENPNVISKLKNDARKAEELLEGFQKYYQIPKPQETIQVSVSTWFVPEADIGVFYDHKRKEIKINEGLYLTPLINKRIDEGLRYAILTHEMIHALLGSHLEKFYSSNPKVEIKIEVLDEIIAYYGLYKYIANELHKDPKNKELKIVKFWSFVFNICLFGYFGFLIDKYYRPMNENNNPKDNNRFKAFVHDTIQNGDQVYEKLKRSFLINPFLKK